MPEDERKSDGPGTVATPARLTGGLKKAALASTAWLAILGIASTSIGLHDALDAREIGVRLVGALLLLAGVAMLSGAVGLLRRMPVGLSLAMIAALLGVAVGIMIFLTQVANDEPDGRLVGWAFIIVASGATALYVRAMTPSEDRAKIWSRLPILKSAVSVGVLVSVAQFWYSQLYLPTRAPPSLTLETKVHKVTPRAKHIVIEGSAVIRNTSDTTVDVLASTLDIRGARIKLDRVEPEVFTDRAIDADLGGGVTAERHISQDPHMVVSHGRLVNEGTYFEAGETITVPVLTWVPKSRYNTLCLEAVIDVARGKALGLGDAKTIRSEVTADGVFRIIRLPEASWLQSLTRGDRYLRVKYDRDPRMASTSVGFVQSDELDPPRRVDDHSSNKHCGLEDPSEALEERVPDPPEPYNRRLTRFYGVSAAVGTAKVSLP